MKAGISRLSNPAGYLLDTNVLSEIRKKRPEARVLAFLAEAQSSALYMSVLTLGEFRKGIKLKRRSDADLAERLAGWVDGLEFSFADRVLGVDATVARIWGELMAERSRPIVDTLLAATAMRHELTLVTRNTADVAGLSLRVVNPWEMDQA